MSAAATAVPAADRVLHVLAALARQGRAMAVGELMAQTGLARSTLYRQLARLRQWGFVLEHGGLYAPGPMSLQLAAGFDLASHLMQAARPVMQELAAQSQESVGLLVAVNGHAVCLDMVESSHSLRCSFDRGRSVPLRAGASALCLLAHLPAAQREALLNEQDIDSAARAALDQRLEAIAKAGCAVSEGEVDAGVGLQRAAVQRAAPHGRRHHVDGPDFAGTRPRGRPDPQDRGGGGAHRAVARPPVNWHTMCRPFVFQAKQGAFS